MSVIKEISVFNGSTWESSSIGVDASNVLLNSNIAGSTNLQTTLNNILPASQLSSGSVVVTDGNKKLSASSITSTQLGYLSGTTGNIQTQINTLNTKLTPQTLVLSSFSGSYTFARKFAYQIGRLIVFSAQFTLSNNLAASTNLFTIYQTGGGNLFPMASIDDVDSRMWNFYIMSHSTHDCYIGSFQYHQSSGRYYICTRQALPAGSYGISGCYTIN